MCRRWSEWCFILELCQPKRDSNTDSFGGSADVIVSEVGKHQPSSWKEWSQPLLPVQCRFIVSATLSVYGVTQWMAFEMWFGLTMKHFSFLPKWKNSSFWHCSGHRIAAWALDPVCTSVRLQQGREGHFGAGGSGVLSAAVLLRTQRKRCTTRQIDKNSPKIICFQSGCESWVILKMALNFAPTAM